MGNRNQQLSRTRSAGALVPILELVWTKHTERSWTIIWNNFGQMFVHLRNTAALQTRHANGQAMDEICKSTIQMIISKISLNSDRNPWYHTLYNECNQKNHRHFNCLWFRHEITMVIASYGTLIATCTLQTENNYIHTRTQTHHTIAWIVLV